MAGPAKYYQALGLEEGATQADIKSAYRKLAFKYHSDNNADPAAVERFTEISIAYETLTNRNKRTAPETGERPRRRKPKKDSGFKSAFAKATAGMQAAEKLHYAVTHHGLMNEMTALLARGVKPAPETVRFVLDRRLSDRMKAFVDYGFVPAQEMVDRAADIAERRHDWSMVFEMLRAPGVVPDERTLNRIISVGSSTLLKKAIDEGYQVTSATIDRAVRSYCESSPFSRNLNAPLIQILTDTGAIPDRATIRYAKQEVYWLATRLSDARKTNMQRAAAAKPKKFRLGKKKQPQQGM